MTISAITTSTAPAAIGPYSQAIKSTGATISVSGQIPIDPVTGIFSGEDIETQTEQCLKNIAAILEAAGASLANVVDVTVLLVDIADFAAMNDVYARFFTEPYPARAAFQIGALPKGARVEIKATAVV